MRRFGVAIIAVVFLVGSLMTLASCGSGDQSPVHTAADGLNLHAVATLVHQPRDGEHFEHMLNTSGINNLDLDGDGHIDYINIKEYGDGDFRGFSLSTALHDGSVQQIAEIQFHRQLNGIAFQIHGNPQIYGNNYYIKSSKPFVVTVGQAVLLNWLFTPRVVFVSPYSRHYLPPAYAPIRVVPVVEYRRVIKPVVTTTQANVQQVQKPIITAPVKSPNEGKSSSVVVAPLANPTSTQKQFQERPETKQIQQASGFAKPKPADASKPAEQKALPTGTVQTPPPATGVAPVTSGRTTTDKPLQQRTDKDIPAATGFVKKPVVPADPKLAVPAPAHQATPAPAPAPVPRVTPQVPSPFVPRPMTPAPQSSSPPSSTPRPSPTEKAKTGK